MRTCWTHLVIGDREIYFKPDKGLIRLLESWAHYHQQSVRIKIMLGLCDDDKNRFQKVLNKQLMKVLRFVDLSRKNPIVIDQSDYYSRYRVDFSHLLLDLRNELIAAMRQSASFIEAFELHYKAWSELAEIDQVADLFFTSASQYLSLKSEQIIRDGLDDNELDCLIKIMSFLTKYDVTKLTTLLDSMADLVYLVLCMKENDADFIAELLSLSPQFPQGFKLFFSTKTVGPEKSEDDQLVSLYSAWHFLLDAQAYADTEAAWSFLLDAQSYADIEFEKSPSEEQTRLFILLARCFMSAEKCSVFTGPDKQIKQLPLHAQLEAVASLLCASVRFNGLHANTKQFIEQFFVLIFKHVNAQADRHDIISGLVHSATGKELLAHKQSFDSSLVKAILSDPCFPHEKSPVAEPSLADMQCLQLRTIYLLNSMQVGLDKVKVEVKELKNKPQKTQATLHQFFQPANKNQSANKIAAGQTKITDYFKR